MCAFCERNGFDGRRRVIVEEARNQARTNERWELPMGGANEKC
jgi:hypothetical protein